MIAKPLSAQSPQSLMHILIPVLHRPTKPTGVCRHAASLARCLANTDQVSQVTLIIGEWQVDYFTRVFDLSSPKIKILDVSIKNSSLSRNQWFVFGLPKLANQLQPDIVHLSFPFPFIRRLFKAPVVATIHDLYPFECPDNFGYPQVWFNQWFLHQCVGQSDGLSCVSQITLNALKTYFPGLGPRKPLTVIYNSVNFKSLAAVKPTGSSPNLAQPYLLSVAQHRKNKNLDLLIRAFASLRQTHTLSESTQLVLVGSSGPETENLLTLIQTSGLQDHVLLLSGLEDSELRWLYENCNLFVIPSSTEGFCLPLVEAKALGCRVVCSDIPIFREVGDPTCHYFDLAKSPELNLEKAMAAAIMNDCPSPGFVNPAFLEPTISKQYLELYQSISR